MEQACSVNASKEDTLEHGSIIDTQGNEVHITEHMIRQACESLAEQLPNHHAVAAASSCN